MKHKSFFQKLGIHTVVGVFLSVQVLGAFAFATPANAQIVAITQKNPIIEALISAGKIGLITGVSHFTRKIAYDTAKYIGSGGKGQKPLLFTNNWDDYLKETAGDSLGFVLDEIGRSQNINLCQLPNLQAQAQFLNRLKGQLSLEIGMPGQEQFAKPQCDWRTFKDVWINTDTVGKLAQESGVTGFLQYYSNSLSPEKNDFGAALVQIKKVDRDIAQKQAAAEKERTEGNGVKPVKSAISGQITTPSLFTQEELKGLTTRQSVQNTQQQVAGLYAADEAAILPLALGTFVNTLAGTLLEKTFQEGLFKDSSGGSKSAITDFYADSIVNNKSAVEKAFNFLFTAVPQKSLNAYDIINEFVACPDSPGLNNCVLDNEFRQAIERASIDGPLTIKEALDQGLLKRNWPLISPLRSENTSKDCKDKGYCYSNLQKLRKVRVVPLGLEIAALQSDPDVPWTLGDVVDGFYDKTKPFYKLVNPNWVLRVPQVRCESKVFGPILASQDGSTRREECVDLSTCITEGPNGECVDEQYYAYCTQEKNTWNIGGQTCEPQFNTCKTFVDEKGTSRSYLSRTVDSATCSAEEVGCTVYSLGQKNGSWISSADVSLASTKVGAQQVIHFNKNILNESCPEGAVGCTTVYPVAKSGNAQYQKTGEVLHIKKAPDYLGCYDIKPSTPEIDYPANTAQLATLLQNQDPECKKFAGVCLESELGCQLFAPTSGGPTVPGIVGKNACDAQCSGYDVYKQEGTQFTAAAYPLYFIPSQAESCQAAYVGCSEFTDLQTEQAVYYSQIKYCERPDGNNQSNFYSWEGDKQNGYVLRSHVLRPLTETDREYIETLQLNYPEGTDIEQFFPVGSPAYVQMDAASLQNIVDTCNEANYKQMVEEGDPSVADADCRAIYNSEENVFYRMLGETISVSDQCRDIRKSDAEFYVDASITEPTQCSAYGGTFADGECKRCLGGGLYQNGSCVYRAIASESVQCPAAANNCREYRGNAGNNIATVDSDDFEPADGSASSLSEALADWTAIGGSVSIAPESVQVGLNSLSVAAKSVRWKLDTADLVQKDDFLELTFWARGVSQGLTVELLDDQNTVIGTFTQNYATGQNEPLSLSSNWQDYRIGPVQVNKNTSFYSVRFTGNSGAAFSLDTVRVRKLQHINFLIKDSWKLKNNGLDAPLACDSNPNDIFPGEFLGCSEYVDVNNQKAYITGFEKLCREDAIGCTPLVDTHNTVSGPNAERINLYNVTCSVSDVVGVVTPCELKVGGEVVANCDVQVGGSSCVIPTIAVDSQADVNAIDAQKGITASTIVVPADNLPQEPVFLTTNPVYRCSEQYKGCMKVGKEEKLVAGKNSTSYEVNVVSAVKNDPDKYVGDGGILCSSQSIGCAEFKTEDSVAYFRDPLLNGNAICTYEKKVSVNGTSVAGWFKKDVGVCKNNPSVECTENSSVQDCGGENLCGSVGTVACYKNYIELGGDFGIWSNKSAQYEGFVGECAPEANNCTELVDPQDVSSAYPNGKPYYVLFDADLKDNMAACAGGVSLTEGCVLFDQTERPEKIYSSALTYEAGNAVNGKKVTPLGGNTQKPADTNMILKVNRDRACSEWLACKNSVTHIDENGNMQRLCVDFRACDRMENGTCVSWKKSEPGTEYISLSSYKNRDTSWYGTEYTGYSLFNRFQITNYEYVNLDGKDYVVYKMGDEYFSDPEFKEFSCISTVTGQKKADWSTCGYQENGRCYEGDCVFPINGGFPDAVTTSSTARVAIGDRNECKAYPEATSPFSQDVTIGDGQILGFKDDTLFDRFFFPKRKQGFENVNVCQNGACSCEYTKQQYKNSTVTDYFVRNTTNIPGGICLGGDLDGHVCTKNSDCGNAGICSIVTKQQSYIGFRGYCLEEDRSRPIDGGSDKEGNAKYACLTWLPAEVSASGFDNYNNNVEAGYYPPIDANNGDGVISGQVYCTESAAGMNYLNQSGWSSIPVAKSVFTYGITYDDPKTSKPKSPIIDTNTVSGKQVEEHGFQLWIEQIINLYTRNQGDEYHQEKYSGNNSFVWFVDDTNHVRNYFLDAWIKYVNEMMEKDIDCTTDSKGKYIQDIYDPEAGDPSFTKQIICKAIPYFTPIAYMPYPEDGQQPLSLSDATWKKVFMSQIKRIYFSVYIPPYFWDNGDTNNAESAYKYYDEYNPIYLDFDEVDNKTKTPNSYLEYPMKNAQANYTKGGDAYWVIQGKNEINGITRYVTLVTLQEGKTKTEYYPLMQEYLSADSITSGKALSTGPLHSAFIVEFNGDGQIIMDEKTSNKRPFKVLDSQMGSVVKRTDVVAYDKYVTGHSVLASSVIYRPICTAYSTVYKDQPNPSLPTNKAFTNRVWEFASDSFTLVNNNLVKISDALSPAGSLNLTSSELVNNLKTAPYKYAFYNKSASGIPQNCDDPVFNGIIWYSVFTGNSDCKALKEENGSGGYSNELLDAIGKKLLTNLENKLFVWIPNILDRNDSNNFIVKTGEDKAKSISYAYAPKVYSINPATCKDQTQKNCSVGDINNVTINGKNATRVDYNGDGVPDEDPQGNQEHQAIIAKGGYGATMSFFAAADDDQMPIKRVMVDWGDSKDIQNSEVYGYYKNRKPYCQNSDESVDSSLGYCVNTKDKSLYYPTITCNPNNGSSDCETLGASETGDLRNKDVACISAVSEELATYTGNVPKENKGAFVNVSRFGNTDRACQKGYFQFVHSYDCPISKEYRKTVGEWINLGMMTEATRIRLAVLGVANDDAVCVFKPRVQVLDNWGYCNGNCGNGDAKGCYGNDKIDFSNSDIQCNIGSTVSNNINPWTSYKGQIVVIP